MQSIANRGTTGLTVALIAFFYTVHSTLVGMLEVKLKWNELNR